MNKKKARRFFTADLHIHSCLSPCAELDMTPMRIMRKAAESGLDIVAIADHNSCENLEAASRAAKKIKTGVSLIFAMEITSAEEVHVLALFDTLEAAQRMQEDVYKGLPKSGDEIEKFKKIPPFSQVIVNEEDEVLGFNRRFYLAGATGLKLSSLVPAIHGLGGVAIASHADRGSFSVTSQLGLIPADVDFDAFEVCGPIPFPLQGQTPGVRFSDAHRLEDIGGKRTMFLIEDASLEEIALALRSAGGRKAVFDF